VTFSRRVPAELQENRLARALAGLRESGADVIDLTESNPTRAGFQYPADFLEPLADAGGLLYRPEPFGVLDARHAVADDFARRGVRVDPGRIVLTASTSEAYAVLFKLLCDPDDEVLVPQPSYPLFEHLTRLDCVTAIPYRLEYHGRWSVDLASVAGAIGPRTRAVLLVSPNNPTGSVIDARELSELTAICAARQIAMISDEVFADYPLQQTSSAGCLTAHTEVLGFTLGGLSKTVGAPQLKVAWTAVSGEADLAADALGRLELICDTYLSVSTPVQLALRAILRKGAAIRQQIHDRVCANYQRCRERVAAQPACSLLRTEAGWSAVIRVPRLVPEEELVLSLLLDSKVLVHPGYFFDFASESFVVVSLLAPETRFADGLDRLLARFEDGRW
jgi:aspartate/methionine/tyrosine aminotransferase